MNETHVAPKPATVKRPLGLIVTILASPHCHLPSFVTSFVVLSLKVAVAINCVVSPILVSVAMLLIATRVTVGDGVGCVVGVVGAVGDGVGW